MKYTIQRKMTFTALAAMVGTLTIASPGAKAEDKAPANPATVEPAEPTFPEWIQKEINKISAAVPGLTADQKSKIGDAFKTRTESLAKTKEAGGSSDEIKEVWSVYVRAVKTIMTPEQFVKFQEMMKPKPAAPKE